MNFALLLGPSSIAV